MKQLTLRLSYIVLLFLLLLPLSSEAKKHKKDSGKSKKEVILNRQDGPYLIHKKASLECIRATEQGLSIQYLNQQYTDSVFYVCSDNGKHQFSVQLHHTNRPAWKYEQPDKLLVLSDPHGDMDSFVSILKSQGVIDSTYSWSFGNNQLMVIGDVFDRGNDVLPIFWLLYKLEYEAINAGGVMHFLLGNHEEMVLRGDVRYVTEKYSDLSAALNVSYHKLWDKHSELGRWLLSKNTIEVVGSNLFVHAGLSAELLAHQYTIPEVNTTISKYLGKDKKKRSKLKDVSFLFGSNGPLWYRGMVRNDDKYNPINPDAVDDILAFYGVERVLVGHTIFDEVSDFQNKRVIGVNVENKKNMDAQKSRGVLIVGEELFKIFDDPARLEKF